MELIFLNSIQQLIVFLGSCLVTFSNTTSFTKYLCKNAQLKWNGDFMLNFKNPLTWQMELINVSLLSFLVFLSRCASSGER